MLYSTGLALTCLPFAGLKNLVNVRLRICTSIYDKGKQVLIFQPFKTALPHARSLELSLDW